MTWFDLGVFAVAILSGATASVVGFGIGSLLTPLLTLSMSANLAVASVMVPHALATALRCFRLRAHIDRTVLMSFGLLSALGGLAGAVLFTMMEGRALTRVLGGLLLLTAVAQLGGLAARWRPQGVLASLVGIGSGFFGGIAGNQGGLRAVALGTFGLTPRAFVATSTAIGLLVDLARGPIYLWGAGKVLLDSWVPITVASVGALIGTLVGERILLGLSPAFFGRVIALAVGLLGLWLFL